jgi:type III secretion protein D
MPLPPSPFELSVQSGLHVGVRQGLAAGTYLVGRSMEADVVLVDDCLAPLHARLALEADGCEVESTADNVVLNGIMLGAGETRIARYPADIVLNGVQLRCTRRRGKIRFAFLRHGLGAAAILICLILLLQGFPAGADKVTGNGDYVTAQRPKSLGCDSNCFSKYPRQRAAISPTSMPAPASPSDQANTGRVGAGLGASPATLKDAADALRQRLLAAGLTTVEIVSDTAAITARGNIDSAALGKWRDIEQWFDRTFGITIVLTSQVEAKSSSPSAPLTVQAIWAGAGPYVIDGRGQKLFAGAVISDGWIVDRIEQNRVVLRRGADLLAVSL